MGRLPIVETDDLQRRARIIAEPKLVAIVHAFADDVTWQRLRVAFEKITELVGRGDNSLLKQWYATHPLKGTKMTLEQGFDFVVQLFNEYLKKHSV